LTGVASNQFAHQVARALRIGVSLLLAHEMPGCGQEARGAVEFASFFECDAGTTPVQLIRAGIYHQVAVPLKGGELRKVSMMLLAKAMSEETNAKPVKVEGYGGTDLAGAANLKPRPSFPSFVSSLRKLSLAAEALAPVPPSNSVVRFSTPTATPQHKLTSRKVYKTLREKFRNPFRQDRRLLTETPTIAEQFGCTSAHV
jgi:hypothetical protein